MWERDEEKTNVWALREKMRNITPDSYLWMHLSPERIPHSSKQQDSKVYQVHDLRVTEIHNQAVSAEKVRHRTRYLVASIQLYTHMHTRDFFLLLYTLPRTILTHFHKHKVL